MYRESQMVTLNGQAANVNVSQLEPLLDALQPNATPNLGPQNEYVAQRYQFKFCSNSMKIMSS